MLDKKAILARASVPTEDLEMPALGGSVRVRGLTVGESATLLVEGQVSQNIGRICAAGLVDAKGKPMFTAEECEGFSKAVAIPVFEKIIELSGVLPEQGEALEKNS